jgi:hypothetical protein
VYQAPLRDTTPYCSAISRMPAYGSRPLSNGTSTLTVGAIATNYNSPGCNFLDVDRNTHIVKLNATTVAYFYKPGCSSSSNITYNIANLNLTNLTISFQSTTSFQSFIYFYATFRRIQYVKNFKRY